MLISSCILALPKQQCPEDLLSRCSTSAVVRLSLTLICIDFKLPSSAPPLTQIQGSSGGPSEDNTTGLLVRSTASNWSPASVLAVDAGSHLASIVRILQEHFPLYSQQVEHTDTNDRQSEETDSPDRSCSPETSTTILAAGPFAGVRFPHVSARANALHIVKEHVATYLITHPHLDHLSAFAINTAAFHNTSRPKRLAALPFTVEAIKQHIFNDVIWPNLTDEDSGVGFVTFQRLTEGGNLALGQGESRGYIEVCNGIAVKGFRVSHGNCASKPPVNVAMSESGRRASIPHIPDTPLHAHSHAAQAQSHGYMRSPLTADPIGRRMSAMTNSQPNTPIMYAQHNGSGQIQDSLSCVVDSSAFFIRAEATGREVLIWGDVEPDSLSQIPRNHLVWTEAATKMVQGSLGGIFIECSYPDSQPDAVLFGHLAPRHVIAELLVLADLVAEKKTASAITSNSTALGTKRKRLSGFNNPLFETSASDSSSVAGGKRRGSAKPHSHSGAHANAHSFSIPSPTSSNAGQERHFSIAEEIGSPMSTDLPRMISIPIASAGPSRSDSQGGGALFGVRVVIIHVKDDMQDGPLGGDVILKELLAHEEELQAQGRGLGCDFEISKPGQSYWF